MAYIMDLLKLWNELKITWFIQSNEISIKEVKVVLTNINQLLNGWP